jgi:hypothetical protein
MFRLIALVLLVACGSDSKNGKSPESTKLETIKTELLTRAHHCVEGYYKGFPCNDKTYLGIKSNDFGDSILYANLLCLSGQTETCIKPRIEDVDSRDMAIGLAAYLLATKDKETAKIFSDYFAKKPKAICFDACDKTRTVEDILARSGIAGMRRIGSGLIEAELLTEANTAPEGYQLRLVADKVVFYQFAGIDLTQKIGRTLYRRQTCNPYFRWLGYHSYDPAQLNVIGKNKYWRFSPSCKDLDVSQSNHWNEIYLINLTLKGVR